MRLQAILWGFPENHLPGRFFNIYLRPSKRWNLMAITPCVSVLRDPRQLGGPWPASRREFWVPDQVPARLPIEHNVCIKEIKRVTTESNAPSNRVERTSKCSRNRMLKIENKQANLLLFCFCLHPLYIVSIPSTMMDEELLRIVRESPIGNSLDGFRVMYTLSPNSTNSTNKLQV